MENQLYLCFPLNSIYSNELLKLSESIKNLYIPEHLQYVSHKEERYLGKKLSFPISLTDLKQMELHLLSILTKLVENFPYEKYPLVIITQDE